MFQLQEQTYIQPGKKNKKQIRAERQVGHIQTQQELHAKAIKIPGMFPLKFSQFLLCIKNLKDT